MKRLLLAFLLIIPLVACSQSNSNNISSEASSGDDIAPSFSIGIGDYTGNPERYLKGDVYELNVNSRYTLNLNAVGKSVNYDPKRCSFKYDNNNLVINDCIVEEQSTHRLVYQLKPLRITDNTLVEVYYHESLCASFNISIKDLSIEVSSLATTSKNLDFTDPSFHDEITIFNDLETYESFMNKYNYFGYVKNAPNIETFENYEYALIRIDHYNLGKDPELNDVFIQDNVMYYDFISSKTYYEKAPDVIMWTNQNYYFSLIRYPANLDVNNHIIWISHDYIPE
jgi:hypothetical protein